jgi:hypothetical protein
VAAWERSIVVPAVPVRGARLRFRARAAYARPDDAPFLLFSLVLGALIGYLAAVL